MSESETPSDPLMQAMTRPPLVWPGVTSDWMLWTVVLAACSLLLFKSFVGFLATAALLLTLGLVVQRIDPHLLAIWEIWLSRCMRPCAVSRFMRFRIYGE